MLSSNNLLTTLSILYLCFFVIIHITLGAKLVVESTNDNDDNSLVDSSANFDIFNKHKDLQLGWEKDPGQEMEANREY